MKLDEIDYGIIERLKENSRSTYVDIGNELGVSDATVYNRVNRLLDLGVIKKFTLEVNENTIKKKVSGFVLVNIQPGSIVEVSKQLADLDMVSEVHEVHGSTDVIIKAQAENLKKLRSVILKLREIPNMVETEFIPIFKTWKN